MNESETRPFRMNVGIALFDAAGRVLIAHRYKDDGPEIIVPGHDWQMPQGGIDPNEDPHPAAIRELYEETGVKSVSYLGETGWFDYDWPPYSGPPHRLLAWRGQRQKWFAMRFIGNQSEIDVVTPRIDDEPEFDAWRWEPLSNVPKLIVPFKRPIYEKVVEAFAAFARA
jgi:putative (di)nucleoside polyphosphate hydrolase